MRFVRAFYEKGCLRGRLATGLLTGWGVLNGETESPGHGASSMAKEPARPAFSVALASSAQRIWPLVNPCGYWRKRTNPGGSASRGSVLTGRYRSFATKPKAPRTRLAPATRQLTKEVPPSGCSIGERCESSTTTTAAGVHLGHAFVRSGKCRGTPRNADVSQPRRRERRTRAPLGLWSDASEDPEVANR
jgi:hypothetical protein